MNSHMRGPYLNVLSNNKGVISKIQKPQTPHLLDLQLILFLKKVHPTNESFRSRTFCKKKSLQHVKYPKPIDKQA